MIKLKVLLFFMVTQLAFGNNKTIDSVHTYKTLSDFIEILEFLDIKEREDFVKKEIKNIKDNFSTPEISGVNVLFFYRDAEAKNVSLIGDLNYWKESGIKMKNIEGTSVFYLNQKLETNARIKYRFKIQEQVDVLDHLNKSFEKSGFGEDSLLEMSDYDFFYKETKFYDNIPHGKIVIKNIENNTIFGSKDKKRKIQIYLPPNYNEKTKYKTMYFCDGSDYVNISKIPNILDYMIDKGELEPIVAVFVDWIERDKEYLLDSRKFYLEFLTDELIPMMESEFSLISDREGRIAVGPSNGGVFVTYVGAVAWDKFKYILNQSGSPYFDGFGKVEFGMKYKNDNLPIKVFSVVGKYEKDYNRDMAKKFHEYLKNNPSIIGEKYVLYPQGHTYTMWGDSFREAILWLLYNKEI